MQKWLFLLCFLPALAFGQHTENFGKFTNADGVLIKGSSMARGYERQIEITNLVANSSGNNTVITFSIPQDASSAVFRGIINTKYRLRTGEIVVLKTTADRKVLTQKINLANIAVTSCVDRNGMTEVTLNAGKIGWTYYAATRSGATTVSSKTGWDAENNTAWTAF